MSNLQLSYLHGNGPGVNVRSAPGRALLNGEIEVAETTGQVLICTDHDCTANSTEWAAAFPNGSTVWEYDNPAYDAGDDTLVAARGTPVYAKRTNGAIAYDEDTNPYTEIVFATEDGAVLLGVVDGEDLLESAPKVKIRFQQLLPTAITET